MIERELEKEYKAMLTKEQYEELVAYFPKFAEDLGAYMQTNYYFDIQGFGLIEKGTTIRIRHKKDTWELQIKIPKVHETGYIEQQELRQKITEAEAKNYIEHGLEVTHPLLKEIWEQVQVGMEKEGSKEKEDHNGSGGSDANNRLKMVGHLHTKRHDFKFYTDMISLDESTYFDIVDYELEWETTNRKFVQFEMERLGLTPKVVGKITRFLEALKGKNDRI